MPTNTGTDLINAGEYRITKMILRSGISDGFVDIRGLYYNFEIFEDMFSPYMTAKIYMNDAFNLPEILPIRGQEVLELEFVTDFRGMDPVKKTFRVYKIDGQIIDSNGRGQQYVLHLMSEGGYFNYTERCGYSVKGKVSNMVGEVFKKHFPEYLWKDSLVVQDTADNFSYVLPWNYTPFKAISWLARKAVIGIDADYSPVFFYETADGYRFQSLAKIISDGQQFKEQYYFIKNNVNYNSEQGEGSAVKVPADSKLPSLHHRIQSLSEDGRFDMIEKIASGVIGSQMTVHDLMRKEKRDYYLKESEIFETVPKLGKKPHFYRTESKENNEFFEKSNSAFFYMNYTPFTAYTKSNRIQDNSRIEEYFLKRKYLLNGMMTQKLSIEIFGDSTKRVGQLMDIYTPKIASDGHIANEGGDKNISGEYMITSICHTFGKRYMCKMELSRNCMGV